jgi:hypothetical protein
MDYFVQLVAVDADQSGVGADANGLELSVTYQPP